MHSSARFSGPSSTRFHCSKWREAAKGFSIMKARSRILLSASAASLIFSSLAPAQAAPKTAVKAASKTQSKKAAAKKTKSAAISIAGVSVTGLAPNDAKRRISRELNDKLDTRIKLTDGNRALSRRRRDLGIRLDVDAMVKATQGGKKSAPLKFKADPRDLQLAFRNLSRRFNFAGRDARIVETGSGVRIVPDLPARKIDVTASAYKAAQLINKNPTVRVLELTSKTTPRKLQASTFKGINARIGSYTTSFNPSNVKRTLNMKIAIKAIDGTILKPNQVFSLNQTVGERTQKRGYRTSIVFQNGYKVPGIGAGVSQVTGTLFNAALLAGLPIPEVRFHSQPVAYLPIGRDATVAWNGFDMKFKNNTGAPIYIKYTIKGSSARAVLFGKRTPGQKVSLAVRKKQKGPRLISAQLYRTIRRNGKVVSKQLIRNHTYKWNVGAWEER
ncbi:MAG TPA: VanW family protein [Abditibacteriaceae bacterium]|nr:VanW family protein [Abditibacteriaceae bacterium]